MAESLKEDLAGRVQLWNRSRKAAWCSELIDEQSIRSVLFIGFSERDVEWENLVERRVAQECERSVWTGLSHKGPRYDVTYVSCSGVELPFVDRAFDLVLSNAVVEHVGGVIEQRRLIAEQARVGRWWVATTPNRWFPIETHTKVPLRHWSAAWRSKCPAFTRLLSAYEFLDLCPPHSRLHGSAFGPTFTAWGSIYGN